MIRLCIFDLDGTLADTLGSIAGFANQALRRCGCLTAILTARPDSRAGRAIMSIRDNRIAAEATGINVTKYKLMAFIISAVFAGMAGVLYALNFSALAAKKFDYNTSILVLVFVVLGGIGNIRGSMIAATVLYVLPELLRGVADYRMLVYAIVLIVMMIFNQSPQIVAWRAQMAERIAANPKFRKLAARFQKNGPQGEKGEA